MAPPSEMQIGVTFWGGQINGVAANALMAEGQMLAKKLGVHAIALTMSTMSDQQYFKGNCIANFTLASLAERPDFKAILADPQFTTIEIFAFDGVSQPDCGTKSYITSSFFTPENTARIAQEFTDFANLLKQYSNKTFILQNWETDNDLYCGASFLATPGSCPNINDKIAAYIAWMNAKIAGVHAANAPNVKVALEFNDVRVLGSKGMYDALDAIAPHISPDYFSYSAYESTAISPEQFAIDIDAIRAKLQSYGKDPNSLMIGEIGSSKWAFGTDGATARLLSVLAVARQKKIPYAFVWDLIDQPELSNPSDLSDWGAYDVNGNVTNYGRALNPSQYVVLTGLQGFDPISNAYWTGWGYDNLQLVLYGAFADNSNTVYINNIPFTPTYQSANQINVQLDASKVAGTPGGVDVVVSVSNSLLGTSSSPLTFKLLHW